MSTKKTVKKVPAKKKVSAKKGINKKPGKMTLRQSEFCYEFVACKGNGSAAARAVQCPASSAKVQAAKWLTNPNIVAKIKELYLKHFHTLSCKSIDVLEELQVLGFSDIRDFVKWDKNGVILLKSSKEMGRHTKAVKEINIDNTVNANGEKEQTVKLKLHDKFKPLESLRKNSGELDEEDGNIDDQIVLHLSAKDIQSTDATTLGKNYLELLSHVRGSK